LIGKNGEQLGPFFIEGAFFVSAEFVWFLELLFCIVKKNML